MTFIGACPPAHCKLCLYLIANPSNGEPIFLTIFFSLARCACHCVDRARGGGEIAELCSGLAITSVHTGGTPDTPATFGYFLFSGTVLDFHLISLQTSSSAPPSDKHLAVSFSVNWKYVIFRDIDTPHFTSAQRFERGSPSQLLEQVIERDFCSLSKQFGPEGSPDNSPLFAYLSIKKPIKYTYFL